MEVHIDRDKCEGMAVCVTSMPDVFRLDEHDVAVLITSSPLGDDRIRSLRDVEIACPTQAISLRPDPASEGDA